MGAAPVRGRDDPVAGAPFDQQRERLGEALAVERLHALAAAADAGAEGLEERVASSHG